jgi:tetratricopeptide (TPR) repeat protein
MSSLSATSAAYNQVNLMVAIEFKNEANALMRAGNFDAAELKYLEALAMKIAATDEQSEHVGRTKNHLRELYMKMGRLDEAQKMLEDALINPGCKLPFLKLQKQVMYSADDLVGELDKVCTLDSLERSFGNAG